MFCQNIQVNIRLLWNNMLILINGTLFTTQYSSVIISDSLLSRVFVSSHPVLYCNHFLPLMSDPDFLFVCTPVWLVFIFKMTGWNIQQRKKESVLKIWHLTLSKYALVLITTSSSLTAPTAARAAVRNLLVSLTEGCLELKWEIPPHCQSGLF